MFPPLTSSTDHSSSIRHPPAEPEPRAEAAAQTALL